MTKETIDVNKLRVAAPCSIAWEAMTGDDRSRVCGQCDRRVYNIGEMTRAEIQGLVSGQMERVCVRLFRRADGTVMTQDCPSGVRLIRRRLSRYAAAVFSSVLAAVTFGYGQDRDKPRSDPPKVQRSDETGKGALRGKITDQNGAVIPGVRMELSRKKGSKTRKLRADGNGSFEFVNLPAGKYQIKAKLDGFKTTIIEDIELGDEETKSLDIEMEVGSISVTVGMLEF